MDALFIIMDAYALFYQAQSNQSQKETNVPYPTPNQTKFLQSIQTATLTLLVAAARVVHPRLEREYWALPRPRLGWFELILQDDRQSRYWEEHFRIHKDAFLLVNLIAPEISKRDTVFRDGNCFVAFGRRWKFSGHRYPLRCRKVNVRYNNERILPSTESADNEISLRSSWNYQGNSTVSRWMQKQAVATRLPWKVNLNAHKRVLNWRLFMKWGL